MAFILDKQTYILYIKKVASKIESEKEYISELDATTGDGDHWFNLNSGFSSILEQLDEWSELSLSELFSKIGRVLMSVVGGSSGILYGSAYIEMGKFSKEFEFIDRDNFGLLLKSMMQSIMKRGNSQPGQKTMIDTLDCAIKFYNEGLDKKLDDVSLLKALIQGARLGSENTKQMPAIRGRACYQANKGVGHLDPGAVTMCYQIETLAQVILDSLQ